MFCIEAASRLAVFSDEWHSCRGTGFETPGPQAQTGQQSRIQRRSPVPGLRPRGMFCFVQFSVELCPRGKIRQSCTDSGIYRVVSGRHKPKFPLPTSPASVRPLRYTGMRCLAAADVVV
ncbi:hypothetical protein BD309DRAFT_246171 [Dichomitus squalens]|nr:hypothetical protein BD309DRAFT_246171 [Dichomitus squalens]